MTTTEFIDMEYKPGDFSILYGARTNGRIFRSVNNGAVWTQVYISSNAARIELAVSTADPSIVYGVVASATNAGLHSVTKSTNSGATFSEVFYGSVLNLMGWSVTGNDTGGQGWYDISIAASPLDANVVLVGGVYISDNNGLTWTDKTNGIRISQMYKLGVSAINPTETIKGLLDNGTKLNVGTSWFDVKGGDGMECLIDYSNNNIQYGTYVNGQIDRTMNQTKS